MAFMLPQSGTSSLAKAGDIFEKARSGEGGLGITKLFRAYTKPNSSEACDILEHALSLPDLDPDFIPRINKRLSAFRERTQ